MNSMERASQLFPPEIDALSGRIIGCAITVHRHLGPGLLESFYERALHIELAIAGLRCESQGEAPVEYRGQSIGLHRLDLVVESLIVVELKAVECIHPLHKAQVISYWRIARLPLGLLLNFNVPVLKDGIVRIVNPLWSPPA